MNIVANFRFIENGDDRKQQKILIINEMSKFRCGYRFLKNANSDEQSSLYMIEKSLSDHSRQCFSAQRQDQDKKEQCSPIDTLSDNESDHCFNRENNHENKEEITSILDFLKSKKQNLFKNILKGFKKHIMTCQSLELQRMYESLTDCERDYSYILKRVNSNLSAGGRSHLKFKNVLESKTLGKIFIHFLQNSDGFWLSNSKIKNKDEYRKYIHFLNQAHHLHILSNNILFYKKKPTTLN